MKTHHDIEWTAEEIADLLNEYIDKILVYSPPSLDSAVSACVNGNAVQINISETEARE